MTEAPSTLNIPLKWAAKERRRDELLQTGFFLFQDGEGCVVVREPAEARESGLEATTPETSSPTFTDGGARSSTPATIARVPLTRVLRRATNQRYILLKKYEGFVTARGKDSFSARLFESNSDYPVIEAEFDLEELSEADRKLAVEGAPLVWTIGYTYEGSTRKRESLIYLRRLPVWSEKELEQAKQAADDLTSAIRWG